jgi:putative endonuclease
LSRERGVAAEAQAAGWLSERGYAVVDRNVRSRRGEVDLVAFEGETLCFIEVRARASERFGSPAATVDWAKQRRITHAAQRYLGALRGPVPLCRFDVVEVTGAGELRLHRGAFEAAS